MTANTIVLQDIQEGLKNEEFCYYYQPKISLVTGKPCGAEALLRWNRRNGTVTGPGEFIPLAEQTGFVTDIACAMFPKLIADMLLINDLDDSLIISFNLTSMDFEKPDISTMIRDAVLGHKVNPKRLQIELTEATILHNDNPVVKERLHSLVEMGVTLAMDDFGTGYSSIDTLSQWPFAVVKIDRGLVQRMQENPKSTTIVQASIRMAHKLGISIVAEGIESSEVYDFLMQSGCTEAQGFWMGRPLPMAEFLAFIRKEQRWSGMPIGLIHIAQLDHIHWRKSLIDQIVRNTFEEQQPNQVKTFSVELDHTQCKLGRWYYGHGQEFQGLPAFDLLEEPHRRLHALGRELIEAAQRNVPHNEIAALLRTLTKESSNVLSMLQELENQAVVF
ncbi:MAG: EAL domain-containing protein [Sulfuricella sp.]|nr:EAL domain-containing protein [Sulfuricella sp.]